MLGNKTRQNFKIVPMWGRERFSGFMA